MAKALSTFALLLALCAAPTAFAQTGQEWDGLQRVQTRNFDAAYLAPGANFSGYTKVMIDPTEAAFRRNWLRDYNNDALSLSRRISDDEAQEMLDMMRNGFNEVFAEAYTAGGYQVVTAPGPDVLRVRTAIVNIDVSAPDTMEPGRSRTYARDAGTGTLILEVRDSMSGALLGRGVDAREIGDNSMILRRSSVSNRSDFQRAFRTWAEMSVQGLDRLRAMPEAAAPSGSP